MFKNLFYFGEYTKETFDVLVVLQLLIFLANIIRTFARIMWYPSASFIDGFDFVAISLIVLILLMLTYDQDKKRSNDWHGKEKSEELKSYTCFCEWNWIFLGFQIAFYITWVGVHCHYHQY